jgi:hypothetical protein
LKERKKVDAEIADVNDAIRENESEANHPEIGEEVALVSKQFIKKQGKSDGPKDHCGIDDAIVPIGENE